MNKVRLATIGNGMVDHRFIEDLLDKSDAANFDITVFCEEPHKAYDRVHLSSCFSHHTVEELSLMCEGSYKKYGVKALVGERATTINRQEKVIRSSAGRTVYYDRLVTVTGSYLWIPPVKGPEIQDCFVYRTTGDLNAIESYTRRSKRGAIVGGGLLGLEAAGALKSPGVKTHVIEFAPMLMAEQLDHMGGEQLHRKIESMSVRVHISKNIKEIVQEGTEARKAMCFADGSELGVDFIAFSIGICLRDKLAIQCGLGIVSRGGITINDTCQISDPDIYAIGECVSWNNRVYGLVAPGYRMAQAAVDHTLETENTFEGADLSARLKLFGADVGGIGDAHARTPGACSYVHLNESKEAYKRLIASEDNKTLPGVVLVDDTSDYGNLPQLVLNAIELLENLGSLILPAHAGSGKPSIGVDKLLDSAWICFYFDVTRGMPAAAINKGCYIVAALKAEIKAGTGCGGRIPLVTQVLNVELAKQGIEINNNLCEHFPYSRQEPLHLIRVEGIKIFEELLAKHGKGHGCEVCKPVVGSLLASCQNEYTLKPQHTPLQNTNDNSLANIQKDGTYSVIPRSTGGEITPEGLVAVGRIARESNLYAKITGSQRVGLFGAQKDDLSEIWRQLIGVGFETGHAYTKALRMVRTCVGSTWCRYGVGDSVGLGVELENRYKGIRTPYKMKSGVSGCTRECAEAQGEDVGIIVTEKGWNLYVCGNSGMKPRHADLLAADIDRETLFKYLNRLMMFYIRTADKLTRTVSWLDNLEGDIGYLKSVIIDDKLGLNQYLEEETARLCEAVVCEWVETVSIPPAQVRLRYSINSEKRDPNVQVVPRREQHRPATSHERIPATLVEENT